MKVVRKNRIRKSTKYVIIVISIILLIFSLSSFINNSQEKSTSTRTKEIYKYTDKFGYDYKINLTKNKYMTSKEVQEKNLIYVTDLIDNIQLYLNYEYLASEKSDLNYTYSIIGKMQVVYTKDGEEQKILERDETLLKEISKNDYTDDLKLTEKLILDLKDKNDLLNDFKQQLGMSINAKYTIFLKINVATKIEEKEINDEFIPIINIDLAEKTTKISGNNNTERTEYISKEYKVTKEQSSLIRIIDLVIMVVAILLLKYALTSKAMNMLKNNYKYELNRILKTCQDKIVEVNTRPNDTKQEVIIVKDFGEILKISEEIFKPILYYIEKENEEAWFSVVSEKTCYRYILKK